jgi:hypothetical protein
MTPSEANFDGARGVNLNYSSMPNMPKGGTYQLRRGKKAPVGNPDFRNQLVWWYPDEHPAQLLYCNDEGTWFNLTFSPTEPPWL